MTAFLLLLFQECMFCFDGCYGFLFGIGLLLALCKKRKSGVAKPLRSYFKDVR